MSFLRRSATLWPLLLLPGWPAWGQPGWDLPPLPRSSLSLDLVTDTEDGWSRQFGASLAGPMELQFNLVYGESRVSSKMVELTPDYRSFGIATDPLNPFSLDVTYEQWGSSEILTIDTARLSLSLNTKDFSISLVPQQRSIKLYLQERFRALQSHFDVDGEDLGVALSYYGLSGWVLNAEYFHYDYSRNPSRLVNDFRLLSILSLGTLELSGGFYSQHASFTATRFHASGEVGCEWFHATSALDSSHTDVGTLFMAFELTPAWTLWLQGGAQWVDYGGDTILFSGMGIDYLW